MPVSRQVSLCGVNCCTECREGWNQALRKLTCRRHSEDRLLWLKAAVAACGEVAEPPRFVGMAREVGRQDCRAGVLSRNVHRGSADQVAMPLVSGRFLLIEDIEDSQKRRLERGVAGLDSMHEGHARTIGVEAVSIKAALLVETNGVCQMKDRVLRVFEDGRPTRIAQGSTRVGEFKMREMKLFFVIEAGRTSGLIP